MTKRGARVRGPKRGEIWRVNFNSPLTADTPQKRVTNDKLPTTGDEIFKTRPAVVMNISKQWNRKLRIVVPITEWRQDYEENGFFWMVQLPKSQANKLDQDSCADTFQVKSVSTARFGKKLGVVTKKELEQLANTIALCIGVSIPIGEELAAESNSPKEQGV